MKVVAPKALGSKLRRARAQLTGTLTATVKANAANATAAPVGVKVK